MVANTTQSNNVTRLATSIVTISPAIMPLNISVNWKRSILLSPPGADRTNKEGTKMAWPMCEECNGSGLEPNTTEDACLECGGRGFILPRRKTKAEKAEEKK